MTNQTTTTTAEKSTNALAAAPGSTAADLASATGLGRSTVTKHLAAAPVSCRLTLKT